MLDYIKGLLAHWLTSKTFWGVTIMLFGAHLHVIGLNLQQGDAGVLADLFNQLSDALGNGFAPDQMATTLGKLGETADAPRYLHSVRGVGVKLVDPG